MFDWEHGIAMHAMQGDQASSLREEEVSSFFSTFGGNLAYILELRRAWTFRTRVCSVMSGFLSTYDKHLRNLN